MTETAIALYLGGTWAAYHVVSYRMMFRAVVKHWWLILVFNLAWAFGALAFIL